MAPNFLYKHYKQIHMCKNEKLIGLLNDLIRINNDRFEGYKNLLTAKISLDKDVRLLVYNMADQSRANTTALLSEVIRLRTAEATGASFSAAIYRPAMGLAKPFTARDSQAILEACKMREEIVQKSYYDVICMAEEIPDRILNVVSDQKRELKRAANMISVFRHVPRAAAA